METREIRDRLQQAAPALIREWFPSGKVYGSQYRVGSLSGDTGLSLCIEIRKRAKFGMWYDHSTGESGDIIGLWMAIENQSFTEALSQIKVYLGIEDDILLEQKKDLRLKRQLKEITGREVAPLIDSSLSRDQDFWDGNDADFKSPLNLWKGDSDHTVEDRLAKNQDEWTILVRKYLVR